VPTNGRLRPPTPGEILSLATDGTRAYLGHTSHTIDVVDVESGQQLRQIEATASPVSLAASPEGRLLAAGTFTGTVDLWETASGRRLESLKGQTALVAGLDFSPDGTMLAVSSRDGSTRLWDITANQFLATVGSRKPGAERVRFFPDGRRLAIGYRDGEIEIRDLQYFFRHAAGSAEYQLQLFRKSGESFPRADEVLAWSRGVLAGR
jgi:WD40 repeat protein